MVRSGRMSGENNRQSSEEEERKHGGDEDPVREEAAETRSYSTAASTESHRHRRYRGELIAASELKTTQI